MKRALPLTYAALTALGTALAVAIGGYFVLVAPNAREIAKLESQLQRVSAPIAPPPASTVPIGETERQLWAALEARVRARFVAPEDQLRALEEVTDMARDAGMTLTGVAIQSPQAQRSLATQGNLAVNPGTIKLTVRHRYPDLVEFFDRIRRGRTYLAVESLNVRRIDDRVESEIGLISLRWVQ
jgi:hypothetical protein